MALAPIGMVGSPMELNPDAGLSPALRAAMAAAAPQGSTYVPPVEGSGGRGYYNFGKYGVTAGTNPVQMAKYQQYKAQMEAQRSRSRWGRGRRGGMLSDMAQHAGMPEAPWITNGIVPPMLPQVGAPTHPMAPQQTKTSYQPYTGSLFNSPAAAPSAQAVPPALQQLLAAIFKQ